MALTRSRCHPPRVLHPRGPVPIRPIGMPTLDLLAKLGDERCHPKLQNKTYPHTGNVSCEPPRTSSHDLRHSSFQQLVLPVVNQPSFGRQKGLGCVCLVPETTPVPNCLISFAAQDLLAEGTADGRRLNPKQYMAMKTRDRTIKKAGLLTVVASPDSRVY